MFSCLNFLLKNLGRISSHFARSCGTHRHSGEQPLGHVRHDDSDEEDDGVEPVVAEDEGDDEEGHAQEYRHARDDVDEVSDLARDRSLAHLETRRQVGNAAHHGAVSGLHHDSTACSCTMQQLSPNSSANAHVNPTFSGRNTSLVLGRRTKGMNDVSDISFACFP